MYALGAGTSHLFSSQHITCNYKYVNSSDERKQKHSDPYKCSKTIFKSSGVSLHCETGSFHTKHYAWHYFLFHHAALRVRVSIYSSAVMSTLTLRVLISPPASPTFDTHWDRHCLGRENSLVGTCWFWLKSNCCFSECKVHQHTDGN